MLNELYRNIGLKDYIKRYGLTNAIKRGVFVANPVHLVKNYEIKKLLWQEKASKKVSQYLKYKDIKPTDLRYGNISEEDPVWFYWHSGIENAPDIVKTCYHSIVKYSGKKIFVLSEENVEKYVVLPKYIVDKKNKGMISIAAYTDLIRAALLTHYGGFWIDSTVYLTDKIPSQIEKQDFFVFSNALGLIENPVLHPLWFVRAKAENKVVKEIRNILFAYWLRENHVCEYLLPNIVVTLALNSHENEKKDMLYMNSDYSEYLIKVISDEYCVEKTDWIKSLTSIHKLSYKLDVANAKENSNLRYILQEKFWPKMFSESGGKLIMKKVLYITNTRVPYRVDFLNELSQCCDLTVLFERSVTNNRNKQWTDSEKKNISHFIRTVCKLVMKVHLLFK